MVSNCIYFYGHEFIDDLMYFHEKYGDIFECDGDNIEVLSTFNRGGKNELH